MAEQAESSNPESIGAPQQGHGCGDRREACEALAQFTGRYRGRPLTDWLIQTRQAEVAARGAVYARFARGE